MTPTIILAGGLGSRLIEETKTKPKPMIQIGDKPLLWHIMMHYASYGHSDFIIALGYKGEVIKDYFQNGRGDAVRVQKPRLNSNPAEETSQKENWQIRMVDTGLASHTGTRLKRLSEHIGNERFFLTYGDGLADVDLNKLMAFHRSHGKLATVTAINPTEVFGLLELKGDQVVEFSEKQRNFNKWVSGGYFVLEPEVLDYISDEENVAWEQEPLQTLANHNQLMAYKHTSFWDCIDTQNDKRRLEDLWSSGNPPWKTWG